MQNAFSIQPLEPVVAPFSNFCVSFSPGWFLARAVVSAFSLGILPMAYCLAQ